MVISQLVSSFTHEITAITGCPLSIRATQISNSRRNAQQTLKISNACVDISGIEADSITR